MKVNDLAVGDILHWRSRMDNEQLLARVVSKSFNNLGIEWFWDNGSDAINDGSSIHCYAVSTCSGWLELCNKVTEKESLVIMLKGDA